MGVYGGKTPHYRIPFLLFGDILDPDDEERICRTIDNQLFGSIRAHSGGNGIIRLGNFQSVAAEGGGTFKATLDELTTEPALEAFINQIYVASNNAVEWTELNNGQTYFLFARLVEVGSSSSRQNADLVTFASTESTPPGDGVLVMKVTINEPGASTFDLSPPEQLLVPELQAHISDNQDPHSQFLMQTNLVTSGLEVLDKLTFDTLQVVNLQISGEALLSGLTEIFGNLVISGETIISGDIQFLDAFIQDATIVSGTFGFLGVASGMDVFAAAVFRDDVTMSGNTRIDGRNVSVDGATLDAHLVDFDNPHQVDAADIGALSVSGGTLLGNLDVLSGVAIDGVNVAQLPFLFSGINVDFLHTHAPNALIPLTRQIGRAPRYCDTVESGIHDGELNLIVDLGRNAYQWSPEQNLGIRRLVTQQLVPTDMRDMNSILLTNRVDIVAAGNQLSLEMLDTDNNAVSLTGGGALQNATYTQDTITASGGQFTPGEFFTLSVDLQVNSGVSAYAADEILVYNTSGT